MQNSLANLRWLHVCLRLAGFRMRGLRKSSAPAKPVEEIEAAEIVSAFHGRWLLKRFDELPANDAPGIDFVGREVQVLDHGDDTP